MKHVKKINELFDDEFQMGLNSHLSKDKIPMSSDKAVNVSNNKIDKLLFEIPILFECMFSQTEERFTVYKNDILIFIVRNEEWHISLAIGVSNPISIDACITYQKSSYTGENMCSLDDDNDDCLHIEQYDDLVIDEVVDIAKNVLLPILKKYNYEAYLLNKEKIRSRLN